MSAVTRPLKNAILPALGSLTPAVDLSELAFTRLTIITPSNFEGNQLAFRVCDTLGGTYVPLHDEAAEIVITAAASKAIAILTKVPAIAAARFLKIEARTTGAAEAQTTAATLKLMFA